MGTANARVTPTGNWMQAPGNKLCAQKCIWLMYSNTCYQHIWLMYSNTCYQHIWLMYSNTCYQHIWLMYSNTCYQHIWLMYSNTCYQHIWLMYFNTCYQHIWLMYHMGHNTLLCMYSNLMAIYIHGQLKMSWYWLVQVQLQPNTKLSTYPNR